MEGKESGWGEPRRFPEAGSSVEKEDPDRLSAPMNTAFETEKQLSH